MRTTSSAGRKFIRSREELRLEAYRDSAGVLTVGWGHTGPDVYEGMVIGTTQAVDLFNADLERIERDVDLLVSRDTRQCEFDALVSFAFNVGPDMDHDGKAEGLGDSTLLKYHNAGRRVAAALEFVKWRYAGGIELPGLLRRRALEMALYLGGLE